MNPGYLNLLPPAAGKIGDVAYRVVGKPAQQTIVCETTVNGTKYICTRPVSDIKNWFKGKTITEKCHKMQLIRKDGNAIEVPTLQKKNHKYYDAFEPLIRVTNLLNERIMRVMETNFYSTVVKKDGEEVTLRSLYTDKKPRTSIISNSQKGQKYPLLEKILVMLENPKYSENENAQKLLKQLKVYKLYMARSIEVFDKDGKELDICSPKSLSMQLLKRISDKLQSSELSLSMQLWKEILANLPPKLLLKHFKELLENMAKKNS